MVYKSDTIKAYKGVDCMPWKDISKTMIREEFVKRVILQQETKTSLCREYGISRPTGDKWLKRYLNGENLSDRSRAPFKTANKTSPDIERIILDYRETHPAIGAVKIRRILQNKGYENIPSASTVNAILKRNGCISIEASKAATPNRRFVKDFPNDMWQADFKGNFLLKNQCRCYPLNVIDDHSRMSLCSKALTSESFESVFPVFLNLFKEYGLPFSLLCDNGNPWGTSQNRGFTNFEVRLMEIGVLVMHGRAFHPQTQGKEESFNRSMTRELLNFCNFKDLIEAQEQFDEYRKFYNYERPHHALGLDVPAQHYCKSNRKLPDKIHDWDYPGECKIRKVSSKGYLYYSKYWYYFSEAFADKMVAVKESSIPGFVNVYFRQFKIARINVDEKKFVSKTAYLIENDPRATEKV